jgi:TP901 family phage tail tape measure protein
MPDFAVSTAFRANDRVTRAFRRMNRGADRFGSGASRAFRRASRSGSRFGDIVKGILTAGAIRKGVGLLSSGLQIATTEFIAFDDAIKSSTARFGDLNVNTVAGQKSIAKLGKIARKIGAETEFTATEAAQGLEFFALAGLSVKESIALLPGTVDLATAANTDLARAVEIGVKSLGAFGIESKNTVELQKNFIRVTDLLAKTSTSAVLDFDTLFESVRTGASVFSDAGQSIETFTALVGKMAKTGVDGEKAGTALRNVMLRLAAPTAEARSALSFLNVEVADEKGKFRDLVDVIADFEKGMKKVTEVERLAALDIIFGKKAITGFNAVLKVGSKGLRSYREELKNSGGAAERMAEIMRGSLGKRLAALKSAAIEVGFKFLEAFKTRGEGAIKALTAALRNFDVTPVISGVKRIGNVFVEIFERIKPFFPEIKKAIKGAVEIGVELFPLLVGAVSKVVDVVKDLIGSFSFLKPIITGITKTDIKVILGLAAAFKAVSVGIGLVNIAMAANPLTLVAGSIAAISGALIILQDKFDIFGRLGKFVSAVSSDIVKFFGFGGGNRKEPFPVATAPNRTRDIIPPNREDTLFRSRQEVNLSGRIQLAGAPEGSAFEFFNAPQIETDVLGVNP